MSIHVAEPNPLRWPSDAVLQLPGSKSEANRLLVAAALSGREVTIVGATPSDDVRHLVAGLDALGFDAAFVDAALGTVRVGPRRTDAPERGELFCGNAGTALRFLLSVAAITPGEWTLTGDAAMRRRPIQPLVAAWRQLGIDVAAARGCPPVRVRGGAPREAKVLLDASVSSQFLSSLLLVGAALPFRLVVELDGALASRDYALLTMRTLHRLGIETTSIADRSFAVLTGYGAVPPRLAVSGDWSAMGVWTCLNHLTGSRVRGGNLLPDSGQADERLADELDRFRGAGERTIDVAAMPDQFPNLAVTAALGIGTTRLTGGANLRVKECDRIAVMARELTRLGADVDETGDGLVVRGGRPLQPGTVDPQQDHRIAMAFALAGLVARGVAIREPDCVGKSYPDFWQDVARVHAQHRPIALVGMRGAGKSTLGRALAARLGSTFVDTDEHFQAQHGPIASFVADHGWPAFRREEQRIVAAALAPGHVVATGGGAVESERTQAELRAHAVVVWLDAAPELLRARLASGPDRPSLTGRPVPDEVAEVLTRRRPIYARLADHRLDAALTCEQQVARLFP